MFIFQKRRGLLGVFLLSLLISVVPALIRAAPSPSDRDGDQVPDEADLAPSLANLPFHWSVQAIVCRVGQGTNAFQASLFHGTSPVRLSRPSRLTAVPLPGEVHASKGLLSAFGFFGDGLVPWGKKEGVRASRLQERLAAVDDDTPVDFLFTVHFTNLGPVHMRLVDLVVPVELGGRPWADATPVDDLARERGFLLPADGKTYLVDFSASMAVREARKFLGRLEEGVGGPDFALLHGRGMKIVPDRGEPEQMDPVFESILEKTVPLRVEGPAGRSWLWRVARKGPEGRPMTIADWAEAVNRVSARRDFLGLPLISFSEDGVLLSLAGWDTGNWDDWWQLAFRGRDCRGHDWASQECGRGGRFYLRHRPPEPSRKERARMASLKAAPPVYELLLGITSWNEGERAEALRHLRLAAAGGSAQAYSWLGFVLGAGEPSEADARASVESYKRSADMGYAPGEAWYGNCLLRGTGVTADRAAALSYLKKAADQRFPEAQALYGLCLLRGVGTKADPAAAVALLEDAAARGDATAQFGVGSYLHRKGDPKGVEWLWLAAAGGSDRAQVLLGEMLLAGRGGVERDPVQAVRWLEAAAAQGNPRAMVALGEAFQAGNGLPKDLRAAARWFLRAAEGGDRQGQTWYALCLLDGLGVERDGAAAVEWLEKAATRGYPEAQYVLGLCLYAGIGGTPRDKAAAVRWFQAASPAQVQARVFLANCYFMGDGVGQNKKEAVRLFQASAREGNVAAQLWLVYCFANGEGVTMDLQQARKWARAAADQGNLAGQAMLENLSRE